MNDIGGTDLTNQDTCITQSLIGKVEDMGKPKDPSIEDRCQINASSIKKGGKSNHSHLEGLPFQLQ